MFFPPGIFLASDAWGRGRNQTPVCHSQMQDPRKMKFVVDVAQTFFYLLTKFRFPEITCLHVMSHGVKSCIVHLAGVTCTMPFHATTKLFSPGT